MRRRGYVCALLAVLLFGASVTAAQETRGSIEGIVKDTSGAVLPGVTVEARSPALVGVATATSDTNGMFRFPVLAPGVYEVTASLAGFKTAKVENIQLALGQILKLDIPMPVASVSEEIQVTAESPIIDVKQNAATANIQAEIIDRIPKGRNFTSILTSAPGTNDEAKAGLAIDGATGSENRYIVDGQDTTNLRTGVSAKTVLTDFLSEVQVKSSGYNAEYRATTGGVVNAITKSGSNSYRGDIGSYFSDQKWAGDVRPSLRLNPANQTLAEYIVTPRDSGNDVEPIADLGGPLFRDRAWFFVGYGPQIRRRERTVTFTSNQQLRTFEDDREDHNVNYNVTSQLSANTRTRFSGANTRIYGRPVSLPGIEPNGTSTSNPTLFPNPLHSNEIANVYNGEFSWVVSPTLFFNAAAGYFGTNAFQVTDTEFSNVLRHSFGASNTCTGTPGSSSCPFPDIPSSLQQLNGYADFPASTRNVRDKYGRFNINIDGTYYKNFAGQHTFKAGVQWERLSNDVLTGAQAPTVTLNWNASRTTLDDPPRQVRGAYGYYTVARTYTEGKIHANNIGLFFQDSWTLNNRLTLNLGVRIRRRNDSFLQAREPESRVWTCGEDRSARRLCLRHPRQRSVEGLRQLGHVLRHQQARDASRRVGCRPLDRLPLHARLLQLADH